MLERYLSDLADSSKPPKYSELIRLSGLLPEELRLVEDAWGKIEAQRRLQIITRLVELAEDDATLDFTAVFKLALNDSDDGVRERTVGGLWECEDRRLISTLARLLQRDPSAAVRAAAAQGLGKFATLAEDDKLLPKDRQLIREVLLEACRNSSESHEVRRRAMEAVSVFNDEEVRALIKGSYGSPDPAIRQSAVFAMGHSADSRWLPMVLKETASQEPSMRYEAAAACGEIGEEAAVPYLLTLLRDEDLQVRLASIRALGAIGGAGAVKALTALLRSPEEVIQQAAQSALDEAEAESDPLSFRFRL